MTEVLDVTQMIPNRFEPIRRFRWLFEIDGIDAFLMKTLKFPRIRKSGDEVEVENIAFELYDAISPSGAKQVYKWAEEGGERTASLKLIDPIGAVVEKWTFEGLEFVSADLGELDYSISEPVTITVEASCKKAKLHISYDYEASKAKCIEVVEAASSDA